MIYEYWFARMKNISDSKKKKLREAYGSAKEIYYIEETQLRLQNFLTKKDIEQLKMARKQKDLEEKYYNMEEKGIDFVPYFQKTYPKRLSELDGAPYALYVKGKLPEEDRQIVDDYFVMTNLIAQHECEHLYVQGAKDCVELLKKLGVL